MVACHVRYGPVVRQRQKSRECRESDEYSELVLTEGCCAARAAQPYAATAVR